MVQGMWVIFARILVLTELHFAYGICGKLLVSCFKRLKCFHSGREGLHFFLWELLYSDFFQHQMWHLTWQRANICPSLGSLQSPLQQGGITFGWEAALGHPGFTGNFVLCRLWCIWGRTRSSIFQRKHWAYRGQFFCYLASAYISWA